MGKKKGMTTRRKLAIATWDFPKEGKIYARFTMDMTEALQYIDHLRDKTGEKVTITHLVGKAVSVAFEEARSLNGRIVLGRFVPFETIDISFVVSLEEGRDLGKVKIEELENKSVPDIAGELREYAEFLRKGKDEGFEKSKTLLKILPTWMLRHVVNFMGFLSSGLGWNLSKLGLEPFPFGTCIITSVGMFGVEEAFAPPVPFARVPLYVVVGAIQEQPVVIDGEIVIRPQITLTATIDHRFIDGHEGAGLAKKVRNILEDPWQLEEDREDLESQEGPSSREEISEVERKD